MASRYSSQVTQADIIRGARAVNPNITIDELIRLAEDPEKLELIKNAKEISFLIIGKTGTGKSTLINGLIGAKVAKVVEGLTTSGVTTEVEPYYKVIDGIKVTVYDTPGLQDGSGKEKKYLDNLYKKCKEGIDLVIFAIRMTDNRFTPDNPDVRAMVNFTKRFEALIWKKTMVVLTCTNICEGLNPQLMYKSREAKQIFFKKTVTDYKKAVHDSLVQTAGVSANIVEKVKVVPTGHEYIPELMDGTRWFTNFWFECLTAISTTEGRVAMIKINKTRFKSSKDVTSEDLRKPLTEQPIVVKEKKSPLVAVGTVLGPALIGGAIGACGFAAGPVGVVGVPLGFFVGMTIGAIGTALYHSSDP